MAHSDWFEKIATPAYVLDEAALKRNLARAARIKREAGCKILLATKAFALPAAFPMMRDVLDGTTASGEYEARLGHDEFGKEVHVYSPAYADGEVERLTKLAQHIYFNSPEQMTKNLPVLKSASGVEDRHPHQSRLFECHARRGALRSVRPLLALRRDARYARRRAVGARRHSSRACAVRVRRRGLRRPHRTRRAGVSQITSGALKP